MTEGVFPAIIVASVIPILLILFASYEQKSVLRSRINRRKREVTMSHEMMEKLIGKLCTFSTGPFGETFKKVEVVNVDQNWIRVRDRKGEQLVNSDYVTSVKITGDA